MKTARSSTTAPARSVPRNAAVLLGGGDVKNWRQIFINSMWEQATAICLIWDKGEVVDLVQPHDVLGQKIGDSSCRRHEALREHDEEKL